MSPFVPKCPHLSPFVPICPHLSPFVPICPHLSPNVPKCPQMSPNVPNIGDKKRDNLGQSLKSPKLSLFCSPDYLRRHSAECPCTEQSFRHKFAEWRDFQRYCVVLSRSSITASKFLFVNEDLLGVASSSLPLSDSAWALGRRTPSLE
jgi:hypothetical protein